MGTNYQRGYNLEYKVKQVLEKNDFLVFRSPASKQAADLFATKNGEIYLVQCKKTGVKDKNTMYIYDLDGLVEMASKYKAKPLLAYSFYYSPVYVKHVTGGSIKLAKDEQNIEFEHFVRGI